MAPSKNGKLEAKIPWNGKDMPSGGIVVKGLAVLCYKERPVPFISKKVHLIVFLNPNFCRCIDFDKLIELAFHGTYEKPVFVDYGP